METKGQPKAVFINHRGSPRISQRTQRDSRLLLINTTNLQNQIIFARRGQAGGQTCLRRQEGGPACADKPAKACSDEASFCLDFSQGDAYGVLSF